MKRYIISMLLVSGLVALPAQARLRVFACEPEWGSLVQELAGEKIDSVLVKAPGNGAAIGGIKVIARSGWYAARPSGTEDIYKIYAESFRDEAHLQAILSEAQQIVSAAISG